MLTDKRLCQLCADTYTQPLTYDDGAGVHFIITVEDNITVVAFRGSASPFDWARNFFFDPLSGVHAGFAASAIKAWGRVPVADQLILTGHSAGGAIAQLVAAMFVSAQRPPARLTTFGTPRICSIHHDSVADLLQNLPGHDYRNGDDPVPTVPLLFEHPRPLVQLGIVSHRSFEVVDHRMLSYLVQSYPEEGV